MQLQVEGRIVRHIADKLRIPVDQVKMHSRLSDLGADSLDLVEILIAIEEDLGIEIPDEEAELLTTVGEAVDHVSNLLENREPATNLGSLLHATTKTRAGADVVSMSSPKER